MSWGRGYSVLQLGVSPHEVLLGGSDSPTRWGLKEFGTKPVEAHKGPF